MNAEAEVRYGGIETVEGTACHHVLFHTIPWDHEAWIDAVGKPVIRKITWTRNRYGADRQRHEAIFGPQPGPDTAITYGPWLTDADPSEETFHFTPPADARRVARFRPQERDHAAAFTLLGRPAPAFGLMLLDGERMVPARLKGSIVLLDFWAGQYDPCRLSMVMLGELAEEYKGKGLAVCAINSGDKVELVRRVVAEANVRIPVALDTNLNVGNRYGLSMGPHFVIIGRDGRIQFIHVG